MLPVFAADPYVSLAVGDVKVKVNASAPARPLEVDDTVPVGSTIITGPGSKAVVIVTSVTTIRIPEKSTMRITDVDEAAAVEKARFEVIEGGLSIKADGAAATAKNIKVDTPSGTAAARGTFFAVFVENGKGYARVREGTIQVRRGGNR